MLPGNPLSQPHLERLRYGHLSLSALGSHNHKRRIGTEHRLGTTGKEPLWKMHRLAPSTELRDGGRAEKGAHVEAEGCEQTSLDRE